MKVSILGCGRWASFLAWYSSKLGHNVLMWGRSGSKQLKKLIEQNHNEYVELTNVKFTFDLEYAIKQSEIIIIAISAQNLRNLAEKILKFDYKDKLFILNMKGIEISTGMRLSSVMEDVLGEELNYCVWVGPGHVQDFTNNIPNCMVVSSANNKCMDEIIENFGSDLIRFYKNSDIIGVEIGAAVKNVIGIAAGMLDGLNLSSLKGALMSRGVVEVSRLIKALGGSSDTAYGLSHLGDYEATVFSTYSQNRMYGEQLVKNQTSNKLAEGVYTAKAIINMNDRLNIDLPIIEGVYNVVFNNINAETVINNLFNRRLHTEF
ncbi:NAD(P)H-dependent glycerol-3-phosphate dehydrogenase [Sedimentibacter sp. zth1]|uniref:NAD(P)H-dependent glycerol-3-phosphate dehydrogenase n=1 Tax=Sedimentibacter sp. zth1 TaxID=2816908 RepID=UPI001A913347|nr:NAD(P)H-dependent glycerol-3-phosphate dehydrogenase [Sedimentibacter sp. zth1]QSX04874.1 NAD(P)H-dependent glycerol-3-phosphate dehydrogenase [Sedimentibacter sp. zth1]